MFSTRSSAAASVLWRARAAARSPGLARTLSPALPPARTHTSRRLRAKDAAVADKTRPGADAGVVGADAASAGPPAPSASAAKDAAPSQLDADDSSLVPDTSAPRAESHPVPGVTRDLPPHLIGAAKVLQTADLIVPISVQKDTLRARQAGSKGLVVEDLTAEEDKDGPESNMPDAELAEIFQQSTGHESEAPADVWTEVETRQLAPAALPVRHVRAPRKAKVAELSRRLQRVLFSPGVHHLRDARTGVWNFDPDLARIPTPEQFAFDRLPQYITASQDKELADMAAAEDVRFIGSTSTLTQSLSHIWFAISGGRGVDTSVLSQEFAHESSDFTAGAQLPAALTLRHLPNGRYAVDNNKEYSIDENVLSDYGRILEKLLTADAADFRRFLKSSPESAVPQAEREEREAYAYSRGASILMRSQLDCYDSRLPGNGTFDIKTRACRPIRNDRANFRANSAYDIHKNQGFTASYEREFYDLTRSGMLKYCLQARIGLMDGIFVAYHNTVRCFGFQYLPQAELDERIYGSTQMAQAVFQTSVGLLERILEHVTEIYPDESLNLFILRNRVKQPFGPDSHKLTVCFQRAAWDKPEPNPLRALTISLTNQWEGKPIGSEELFGSLCKTDPDPASKWSLGYTMTTTQEDYEGYRIAHQLFDRAAHAHKAMNNLYVPEGSTPGEMARLSASKAAAKARAAKQAGTAGGASISGTAKIRWMQPNARVAELRDEAKRLGAEYAKLAAAWDQVAQNSFSHQAPSSGSTRVSERQARRRERFNASRNASPPRSDAKGSAGKSLHKLVGKRGPPEGERRASKKGEQRRKERPEHKKGAVPKTGTEPKNSAEAEQDTATNPEGEPKKDAAPKERIEPPEPAPPAAKTEDKHPESS